ncbi:hypothetical protein [Zavarzinella formosa]|uniref:hypothetical protein n=1 Tax=Zavarzinella formosa TaxID=360055 RepID=UPI000315717A|nr:hypothetical protein [Zavarzinella formosa]
MNPLQKIQFDHNKTSRDRWNIFGSHREKVTGLLAADSTPGSSRLCVLGAGNCNDLNLGELLAAHGEIHLVDLDGEALQDGIAKQGLADNATVRCHGGIDVTGMLDKLALWTPHAMIQDSDLTDCTEEPARQIEEVLPGPFDVVASTCLLSQLIDSVVRAVGERHPRFVELMQAVRAGHLRLLSRLIAPGGVGVLITDVVSTVSFLGLDNVPETELPGVLDRLIRERNFFHGVNPSVLVSLFRSDPVLSSQVVALEPLPPWRWDIGPRRYLVFALRMRRNHGEGSSG